MKKILASVYIAWSIFTWVLAPVAAQSKEPITAQKTEVIVFVREGCTHCSRLEKYLDDLQKKRSDFSVKYLRLENPDDYAEWDGFTTRLKISKVTPITVIGTRYLIGFSSPDTTGEQIIKLIQAAQQNRLPTELSAVEAVQGKPDSTCVEGPVPCDAHAPEPIALPFIGTIDPGKYPLFILSALLGFFDGFNPCAMWVLITFLIILLQVGNRRKMFLFAGTFIVAEAVMYTLILTVWYKTWDFVKLDTYVTPVVGILAIAGGLFFLNEYRKKELECKVTNLKTRAETRNKIMALASGPFTVMTFLAILGIAFSVNIIEFACSIGIPQAFTKVLEMNNLSFLQSLSFIGIYILFYMIDDFIMFAIALYGADKLAITTRYSKLSNLIGGIVMIILGILLIVKPDMLLF